MVPSGGQLRGEFGGCRDPCTIYIELVILVGFQVVQFESRDLNPTKICTAGGLSNLGHGIKSHKKLFLGPFGDCTQITKITGYGIFYNGIHYSVTGLGAPEVFLAIWPPEISWLLASRGP